MTIKIEATHHDLAKIEKLVKSVDLVLNSQGSFSSWRDVMYEVQEMLAEAETRETETREAEPLIKDDKIRKAVRAWAKANGYGKDEKYEFNGFEDASWKSWPLINYGNGSNNNEIEFNGGTDFKRAEGGSYHTIAEL